MAKTNLNPLFYDMRPPTPSSRAISNVMKANVAKDTKPEILMRKALSAVGLRGYRLNWKGVLGRPDITFIGKKVAIFVHGCYWHRCPYCKLPMPKSNKKYWKWKFERNKERDKRKWNQLEKAGWKVFEFWECQLERNPIKYALRVKNYIQK